LYFMEIIYLITTILTIIMIIVFFVLAVNVGTLVRLVRHQNEILTALFKLNGGEVEERKK
jgi:hypothetical protein